MGAPRWLWPVATESSSAVGRLGRVLHWAGTASAAALLALVLTITAFRINENLERSKQARFNAAYNAKVEELRVAKGWEKTPEGVWRMPYSEALAYDPVTALRSVEPPDWLDFAMDTLRGLAFAVFAFVVGRSARYVLSNE